MNEDTIYISGEPLGSLPNLCIVADGMGGHNGGEVASARSVSYFCSYVAEKACQDGDILDFLTAAASYANGSVYELSKTDASLFGMGTTFTACVTGDDKIYIVHIGDSRLYSLSGHQLKQQTNDHSYVNEMVRSGKLSAEQARVHPNRNMLTRVLGVDARVQIDGLVLGKEDLQMLLLCSDGLTNMLTDEDITEILIREIQPEQKTGLLIDMANERGGHDNISVVLIDFIQEATR